MQSRIRQRLLASLLFVGCVTLVQEAHAGPWVKSPGETYIKTTAGYYDSDKVYDVDGNLTETEYKYSHLSIGLYGELGFAPRLAFQFDTSFLSAQNERNEGVRYKRSGPSDLDLGLQYQIFSGGCALSGSFGVRVPLYEDGVAGDSTSGPLTSGSTAETRFLPALGDGSIDLMPRAHFGCSLPPLNGWFTLMAGPRIRFNGFGESLDYAVGVGSFILPDRLALSARVGGTQRFSDDNESPTKSYVTVGGGLLVRIFGGLSFEANGSYIPVGAFVARGWSASVGLSYNGRVFPNPFD